MINLMMLNPSLGYRLDKLTEAKLDSLPAIKIQAVLDKNKKHLVLNTKYRLLITRLFNENICINIIMV